MGDINPEVASGAGNMTSTMSDLAVWVRALADGDLLSPELQAERLEFRRFEGQALDVGYGLGVIRLNDVIGHDGAIMGYSTVAMYLPEADATFVLIGNGSSNFTTPTMDIFLQMLAALYPDQVA
jgi:D-alanyl-D-alanine carboxypeptidase